MFKDIGGGSSFRRLECKRDHAVRHAVHCLYCTGIRPTAFTYCSRCHCAIWFNYCHAPAGELFEVWTCHKGFVQDTHEGLVLAQLKAPALAALPACKKLNHHATKEYWDGESGILGTRCRQLRRSWMTALCLVCMIGARFLTTLCWRGHWFGTSKLCVRKWSSCCNILYCPCMLCNPVPDCNHAC